MKVIYTYYYTTDGKCFAIGYNRSHQMETNGIFSEEVDPITHEPIKKEDREFESI